MKDLRTYFDVSTSASGIKNENKSDKQLAEELHKKLLENL